MISPNVASPHLKIDLLSI